MICVSNCYWPWKRDPVGWTRRKKILYETCTTIKINSLVRSTKYVVFSMINIGVELSVVKIGTEDLRKPLAYTVGSFEGIIYSIDSWIVRVMVKNHNKQLSIRWIMQNFFCYWNKAWKPQEMAQNYSWIFSTSFTNNLNTRIQEMKKNLQVAKWWMRGIGRIYIL